MSPSHFLCIMVIQICYLLRNWSGNCSTWAKLYYVVPQLAEWMKRSEVPCFPVVCSFNKDALSRAVVTLRKFSELRFCFAPTLFLLFIFSLRQFTNPTKHTYIHMVQGRSYNTNPNPITLLRHIPLWCYWEQVPLCYYIYQLYSTISSKIVDRKWKGCT